MPLGAFRLNGLAKLLAAAIPSRTPITLTAYGNAQIDTAQSKFGGSSALFDDNGDYIQSNDVSAGNFAGDFTVECWINTSDTEGEFLACFKQGTAQGWQFITRSSGRLVWCSTTNGSTVSALISSNNAFTNSTWTHVAVCHTNSSGLTEVFANGVRVASRTEQNPITVDSGGYIRIGGNMNGISSGLYQDAARYYNGWVDDVRFSTTVRYSGSTYTVPTAAFVNDANTTLLLHMDGTDASTVFRDDAGTRTYTNFDTIFGGEIDTAQSKFGGASWYQDAEYDGVVMSDETPLDIIGTGEFTLEMWVRRQNNPTANNAYLWDGANNRFSLYYDETNNQLKYSTENIVRITGGSLTLNTWIHVAVVRNSSSSTKLYINGTQSGSTTTVDDRNWSTCVQHLLGVNSSGIQSWVGHIDEIRISNVQRYTTNFTPSTTPFVNDENTILLLHMDGTDGSTIIVDDNG